MRVGDRSASGRTRDARFERHGRSARQLRREVSLSRSTRRLIDYSMQWRAARNDACSAFACGAIASSAEAFEICRERCFDSRPRDRAVHGVLIGVHLGRGDEFPLIKPVESIIVSEMAMSVAPAMQAVCVLRAERPCRFKL